LVGAWSGGLAEFVEAAQTRQIVLNVKARRRACDSRAVQSELSWTKSGYQAAHQHMAANFDAE
jgi:hypothetical protein